MTNEKYYYTIKILRICGNNLGEISKKLEISQEEINKIIEEHLIIKIKVRSEKNNTKKIKLENSITKLTGISTCSRSRVRELIRIRDNHTCQICGKIWDFKSRRFDVHHKDCVKEKSRQCDNYEKEKDNMTTLCHKCHLNLDDHRKKIKDGRAKWINNKKLLTI